MAIKESFEGVEVGEETQMKGGRCEGCFKGLGTNAAELQSPPLGQLLIMIGAMVLQICHLWLQANQLTR